MTTQHRSPPSAYFVLFFACMFLFAASVSCSKTKRGDTLRASVTAVNASRDGFTSWDRNHQQEIVENAKTREEAEAALQNYRTRRQPVLDGFEIAYRALAVAATQSDDPSLKTALEAAGDLVDDVKKLIGGQ